jgi:hypothetical protein
MAVFWVVAPCSLVATRLHGATTQKTAIFVVTAVRTSNPIDIQIMQKIVTALGVHYASQLFSGLVNQR